MGSCKDIEHVDNRYVLVAPALCRAALLVAVYLPILLFICLLAQVSPNGGESQSDLDLA